MGYQHLKFPANSLFLVTGAAGFIGSNLCEAILNMGYRVRALDDLSTGKQKNVDMFLDNPNYEFVKGDIKDLDTLFPLDPMFVYVQMSSLSRMTVPHGCSENYRNIQMWLDLEKLR